MKHKIVVSMLAAIVIFAATTSAEAGIFGRLSVVWNGCNPCEPVACQPCEPIACVPCEPIVCQPCEPICDPCIPFGPRPFRPFGGLFAGMKARFAAVQCGPVGCEPCEPVACAPCEPVVCAPCEPVCDPCAVVCAPRPFAGLFSNLRARMALSRCAPIGCDPCEPVAVCEPVCDPCVKCRW